MRIYTKKGDKGQTFLADGTARGKEEVIYEVIGTIDELNSWIGYCRSLMNDIGARHGEPKGGGPPAGEAGTPPLQKIQSVLFTINAIIAKSKNIKLDIDVETKNLEREIDKMEKELASLKNFILPGGHELAAMLHITRTICRRAERRLVAYQHVNMMARTFIPYFNRLSDYFFTMARWVNYGNEIEEITWQK